MNYTEFTAEIKAGLPKSLYILTGEEEYLKEHLPKVHVTPANATYVLWMDCGAFSKDTEDLCGFLREKTGLILTPGMHYRGDSATFVRMNIACNRCRLKDGLERFVKGLKEYQGK